MDDPDRRPGELPRRARRPRPCSCSSWAPRWRSRGGRRSGSLAMRGLGLFALAYVFNVFRGALPLTLGLASGIVTSAEVAPHTPGSLLTMVDILQLAGLSLIGIAALRRFVRPGWSWLVAGGRRRPRRALPARVHRRQPGRRRLPERPVGRRQPRLLPGVPVGRLPARRGGRRRADRPRTRPIRAAPSAGTRRRRPVRGRRRARRRVGPGPERHDLLAPPAGAGPGDPRLRPGLARPCATRSSGGCHGRGCSSVVYGWSSRVQSMYITHWIIVGWGVGIVGLPAARPGAGARRDGDRGHPHEPAHDGVSRHRDSRGLRPLVPSASASNTGLAASDRQA